MNFELQNAVDSFIVSSRLPAPPDQQSDEFVASPELHEMAKLVRGAPADERREALVALAEAMSEFAPFGAGRCAIYFGAGVEGGADPAISISAVLDQLRRQLTVISDLIKSTGEKPPENLADIPNATAEQLETIHAMQFVAQSAVSHLVRSEAVRKKLAVDEEFRKLLDAVRGYHYGADWVLGVLSLSSGELIVLFPQERTGFWISYKNVGNNFHLFTLLQQALAPVMGLDATDREKSHAAARGEVVITQEISDSSLWDYHQYLACKGKSNPMLFVWGEASPETIPKLDGQAVLLVTPVTMKRGWSGGFFGPQLKQSPPSVEILTTLTADEVEKWMERARQATGG